MVSDVLAQQIAQRIQADNSGADTSSADERKAAQEVRDVVQELTGAHPDDVEDEDQRPETDEAARIAREIREGRY